MKNPKLWTALISPMKGDGSVHYDDLRHLILRQEKAGNGVLILGSTGEGISFAEEEKREIIRFAASLNIKVPVMAGVGGMQMEQQLKWVEYCNTLEIDSFLLVTPLYSKPGFYGQLQWFRALLDKAQKRCMIYNIPSRTGVKLIPEVLQELKGHPMMWSVKEASGSVDEFRQFRNAVPDIPLYSGDDGLLPQFAKEGCAGLVSVAANVWPEATKRYVDDCLNGKLADLPEVWGRAVKMLFSAPNPVPAKLLLHHKKEISSKMLRPPLSERDLDTLDKAIESDLEINNWFGHQQS